MDFGCSTTVLLHCKSAATYRYLRDGQFLPFATPELESTMSSFYQNWLTATVRSQTTSSMSILCPANRYQALLPQQRYYKVLCPSYPRRLAYFTILCPQPMMPSFLDHVIWHSSWQSCSFSELHSSMSSDQSHSDIWVTWRGHGTITVSHGSATLL